MATSKICRGSEWRKWDLQVGTKYYTKYKGPSFNIDVLNQLNILTGLEIKEINSKHENLSDEEYAKLFVEYFVNCSEIDVVAIANHNTGKGIQEIIDYFENQYATFKHTKAIFPAVEIGGTDKCHVIIIFNPNCNNQHIYKYDSNGDRIGKLRWEEYINKFLDTIGIREPRILNNIPKNSSLSCLDIIELAEDWDFIAIFPHAHNDKGLWKELHESTIKEIYKHPHFGIIDVGEDCSNEYLVNVFNGKNSNWGSREIAIIETSDAASLSEIGKTFSYIKADPTFEGLKQIIYEPSQRICKKSEVLPDKKENNLVIDKVRYKCSDNTFTDKFIHFNRNLNVIIGGKSSGKSLLLSCIAEVIKGIDLKKKYKFLDNIKDFDFEVYLSPEVKDCLSDHSAGRKPSIIPEIKYIPQNHLAELADHVSNKKSKELNEIVRKLLKEDINSYIAYEEVFIKTLRGYDKTRETIISDYFDLLETKENLSKTIFDFGNKDVLKKSIKDKKSEIKQLLERTGLTEEQNKEYESYKAELKKIRIEINKVQEDYKKLKDFSFLLDEKFSDIKIQKDQLQNTLSKEVLERFISLIKSLEELQEVILKETLSINSEESDNFIKQLIQNKSIIEEKLQKKIAPFIQKEEDNLKIEELERRLEEEKLKLASLDKQEKELEEINIELENKKKELFLLQKEIYKQYKLLIDSFNERTSILEKEELIIMGKTYYNFHKLWQKAFPNINKKVTNLSEYYILNQNLSSMSEEDANPDKINECLNKLFDDVINEKFILSKHSEKKAFLITLFNDNYYDYWEVEYRKDILGEMSTGKASFVILMLIVGLSNSKSPILIDQPEDNLDNRSISTQLVSYLKEKKLERQIILVTHNPNVVVNADAENVIVADQRGQNNKKSSSPFLFNYVNGAMENSKEKDEHEDDVLFSRGIKQHITDIVEGGEEAFIRRERKYNLTNSLY